MADLYLQLQKNLVRGYNIQTLEFRTWFDADNQKKGDVVITYLCGERVKVPQDPVYTTEERQAILEKILEIQEAGCYPQSQSSCELGITSLN